MGNPDILTTLSTQDVGQRQTKHKNTKQKTEKMSNTNPTKNWWVMNPGECSLSYTKILILI
jgi:hypothetical protein